MDDLDPGQRGVGDMDIDALRRHGHRVVDWIADYLDGIGELPVLSPLEPGAVAKQLQPSAPTAPEPMEQILADLDDVVVPGLTHWNHPAFHAYFAITGSGPGILAEALIAAFNVNGMLWRTSPVATEMEEVTLDWLRQLLGLPQEFRGIILDTASMATLVALAGARESADLDVRGRGLAGRSEVPPLVVYTSEQAHSSVDKAAITLGLGHAQVRHVATDEAYRLRPDALHAAIARDLDAGARPLAIVATTGTTSTTSVDPVAAIADVRDEVAARAGHPIWLHVDGAYGGALGMLDSHRWILDGVERADSFVTNPHKWLFTPIDCTALYVRDPAVLQHAFALVPEYLTTAEAGTVTDYMDWGVQLGRRFRALKLWMVLRYFGADGLRDRLREHLRLTDLVVRWVDEHEDFERLAPAPMSTVCFRAAPRWLDDEDDASLRRLNEAVLESVNLGGEAYLSHTELRGRYTLRLAIGNLRTTEERLRHTLEVIAGAVAQQRPAGG